MIFFGLFFFLLHRARRFKGSGRFVFYAVWFRTMSWVGFGM